MGRWHVVIGPFLLLAAMIVACVPGLVSALHRVFAPQAVMALTATMMPRRSSWRRAASFCPRRYSGEIGIPCETRAFAFPPEGRVIDQETAPDLAEAGAPIPRYIRPK
jgi:hypothetical protein